MPCLQPAVNYVVLQLHEYLLQHGIEPPGNFIESILTCLSRSDLIFWKRIIGDVDKPRRPKIQTEKTKIVLRLPSVGSLRSQMLSCSAEIQVEIQAHLRCKHRAIVIGGATSADGASEAATDGCKRGEPRKTGSVCPGLGRPLPTPPTQG